MNIEIIAELAQGFEGNPEQAHLLLKAAAVAGADAVKFQLVYADELATPDYKYYTLFKSLEMADEVWESLAAKSKDLGIQLYLDIYGTRSLNLAEKIKVTTIKLHATDIANIGLLHNVAYSSLQRVVLGAGGAYASEIQRALQILEAKQVVVLLGFQGYPTLNEDNQIDRIRFLTESLCDTHPNVSVGFADHAFPESLLKHALAVLAIGSGAKVIEKHLTLGRVMKLEDHESALNPDEFYEFSKVVRDCEKAIGKSQNIEDYSMSEAEQGYRKMIRRHVVTTRDLTKGMKITPADVILKRTSSEHVLTDISQVYQRTLKYDILKNNPVSHRDIN